MLREQGARCMDCGIPFCHYGLPARQPDPGLERPRLPRPLAGGDPRAPRDEQLPRVHRPHLPGAVRGVVRARHQRRRRSRSSRSSSRSSTAPGRRAGSSPSRPPARSGKTVAVIGSGPAGLAAAAGAEPLRAHRSRCSSGTPHAGGLLRFGVPDFKLEKWIVQRRVDQMVEEGVELRCGVNVGRRHHGRRAARAVRRGRARDRLHDSARPARARAASSTASTSRWTTSRCATAGSAGEYPDGTPITAAGKHVVIIGGGDTGADCLGNSHREEPAVGHAARAAAAAAGHAPRRPHAVAAVAADHAHLGRARGGRRARLQRDDHALRGRGREGQAPARPPRRAAAVVREDRGLRVLDRLRPRAARDGLPAPAARGRRRAARRRRSTAAATWTRRSPTT